LAFLQEAGNRHGFSVSAVEAVRDEAGVVISSSRIRDLLSQGEPAQAATLLGYRYTVLAPVEDGRRLGRTLGYPTANLRLGSDCGLANGIYAVRVRRAGGSIHDGVASFGRRPTVEADGEPLLEAHLFDFSGDLYGETITVSLFEFLRAEAKFSDLDGLKAQMRRDEALARERLANVAPLGPVDGIVAFAAG
jgi:riboflavin kinase/FMN adenylyltransferase